MMYSPVLFIIGGGQFFPRIDAPVLTHAGIIFPSRITVLADNIILLTSSVVIVKITILLTTLYIMIVD